MRGRARGGGSASFVERGCVCCYLGVYVGHVQEARHRGAEEFAGVRLRSTTSALKKPTSSLNPSSHATISNTHACCTVVAQGIGGHRHVLAHLLTPHTSSPLTRLHKHMQASCAYSPSYATPRCTTSSRIRRGRSPSPRWWAHAPCRAIALHIAARVSRPTSRHAYRWARCGRSR